MSSIIQTDILIAGAGPAGAGLAAFMGQNGLEGLVIAKDSTTAYTPRAHGFNPFAFECLRDIDLEDEGLRLVIRGPRALSMRFARSLAGQEYSRVPARGEKPEAAGKVNELSPCEYVDLTQRHIEPLLVRYASHHGLNVRFSTELTAVESLAGDQGQTGFLCTVHDHITQQVFQIHTKYLFGADGARSVVARSLDFKFLSKPGGIKACNVLLRANLAKYMAKERHASLNWIVKPDNKTFPGIVGHLRAVRPWNEWVMAAFGSGGSNPFEGLSLDNPKLVDCVREFVGDDKLEVEILAMDPWTVRESVAEEYRYSHAGSDAYILGDAAHRHPPTYGLGSNTCIQDAYNLAWKTAFVLKGIAGHGLLASFSQERQPVGADLVRESNDQIKANSDIWEALGMRAASPEAGVKEVAELAGASASGAARRAKLHKALETKRQELESLGLAYNQWYTSNAVYLDDEVEPRPLLVGDPVVEVQVNTFPGSRLPHVWLDIAERGNETSTLDLGGKGRCCVLTGVEGRAWREAAENIQKDHGIPIATYGIGQGLDYIDIHRDWFRNRGVEEDGCVLVTSERFVAWRSVKMADNCEKKLMQLSVENETCPPPASRQSFGAPASSRLDFLLRGLPQGGSSEPSSAKQNHAVAQSASSPAPRPTMASRRPRSNSLPTTWSHPSTLWPHEYSPLSGPRTMRLLFLESQSRDYTRHFITGHLEVVDLDDFERRYVALSYTWGPAIRERFARPGDASRIIPTYELLIRAQHNKHPSDDCHIDEKLGAKLEDARGYTNIKLAPNMSDYFTHNAEWHIIERVPLWIDAICINQQDPVEVADQILLQADIYTMARQTNVWLGACQKDLSTFQWWHDVVYQTLVQERSRHRQSPYILDLMFKTGDHLNAQFWTDNFNLAPPCGSSWPDLWKSYVDFFFARRWFSRLWTIQEVMLAQKVYMLCGPRAFDFSDVLRLDRWLLSSFFRTKPSHDTNGGQAEQIWPRWNPGYIFEIIQTRINHVQLQAFPTDTMDEVSSVKLSYLLGILQCARGQETTFPRDKVLGLLGVATRFVPKNKVQLLVRDLGGSDRDVFVSFARYYIQRQCLDILSYAGHRHGSTESLWPSWVPNWDDVSQSGFHEFSSSPGGHSLASGDTKPPQGPFSDENFRAGLDLCVPRVVGETLHLYGIRVGVIAEAYAKDEWTQKFTSLITFLGSTYCLTGEPIQEAILRTIFRIAEDDSSRSQRSRVQDTTQFLQYLLTKLIRHGRTNSQFAKDLEALLISQPSMHSALFSIIQDALSVITMLIGTQASIRSPTDSNMEPPMQHGSTAHQSFSIEVEVMQKIFNIFVTPEGVLGNGSKSIKPGDEIWVVRNGPVPLVLERGVDGHTFRLISTAYVHGVRYDEIFRGKAADDLAELRIV